MAKNIDEKVMAFVEQTLAKNPSIAVAELFEKAKEVSDSIQGLSLTQFHARYPLQVKRRKARAKANSGRRGAETVSPVRRRGAAGPQPQGQKRKQAPPTSPKEEIRQVFLRFAADLAGAEGTADLVRVLADVDRYVDQVLTIKSRD